MEKQIVVYKAADDISLEVQTDGETVWLTQEQMCLLFGRTQPVIARHIANIFREGELTKEVVYAKFAYTTRHGAIDGKTQTKEVGLYNLDVVISVGYRVKSIQGTRFRQWATKILREMLLNRLDEISRRRHQADQRRSVVSRSAALRIARCATTPYRIWQRRRQAVETIRASLAWFSHAQGHSRRNAWRQVARRREASCACCSHALGSRLRRRNNPRRRQPRISRDTRRTCRGRIQGVGRCPPRSLSSQRERPSSKTCPRVPAGASIFENLSARSSAFRMRASRSAGEAVFET